MASPTILSRLLVPLIAVFIICCTTSCKEHEKLAAETARIQQQIEELRAEKAEKAAAASEDPSSTHPVARQGSKALESGIVTLRGDIAGLEERKKQLETELATLQKDFADYRAKTN